MGTAALIIGLAIATGGIAKPDVVVERRKVDGVERSYELYVPQTATLRAPLLIVLHGRGGSAPQVREHSGFDDEATRLGWVVAYPQGIDNKWSDLRRLTVPDAKLSTEKAAIDSDITFLLGIIDDLSKRGLVDDKRVLVAGHSNGAMMTLTLACTHASRFLAIGVVAGNLAKTECALSSPVAAIFFHGTEDPLVPFAGGGVGPKGARGFIASADETVATFATKAACGPATKREPVDAKKSDNTKLVVEDRAACRVPIERYIIEGGGHGWPNRPPKFLKSTEEVDATHAMADFFARVVKLASVSMSSTSSSLPASVKKSPGATSPGASGESASP